INGIYLAEKLCSSGCLICLQMTDHVPLSIAQVTQFVDFASEFLNTVFAKDPQTGVVRLADLESRDGLVHAHQCDFCRFTVRAMAGSNHALSHSLDVFGNGHLTPLRRIRYTKEDPAGCIKSMARQRTTSGPQCTTDLLHHCSRRSRLIGIAGSGKRRKNHQRRQKYQYEHSAE